jgi:hypothetical protein
MSVIRVGSSSKYAEGWDSIFGGRKASSATKAAKGKAVPAAKAGKKKASRAVKKKAVTKARTPGKSRRG